MGRVFVRNGRSELRPLFGEVAGEGWLAARRMHSKLLWCRSPKLVYVLIRAQNQRSMCMAAVKGKVVEGGRIIVPAAFRQSLGLTKGDTVLMELHGDELRIRPARAALRRIQDKYSARAPADGLV